MPFTVQDLTEGKPAAVSVSQSDSVETALERMIEGDFSQLPVVDDDNVVKGLITSDSILRTLNHFNSTVKGMRVFDAMQDVKTFSKEDNLFDLLDYLKDAYAVVIVESENRMTGIVTNYDTTEYFRKRGEDIMFVEDVETMLKEYILSAFQDANADTDEVALQHAIASITPSNAKFYDNFNRSYEDLCTSHGLDTATLDRAKVQEAFARHFNPPVPPKAFEKLTLGEYIELFLHKSRWRLYEPIFGKDAESCRRLLSAVREIRNDLAHFRAELTLHQRDQLRFCKDWLARHQQMVTDTFVVSPRPNADTTPKLGNQPMGNDVVANLLKLHSGNVLEQLTKNWNLSTNELPLHLAEDANTQRSKYAGIATFLESFPLNLEEVTLAFMQIDALIDGDLPKTAYEHRSWWANDSVGHVQSRQWLEVGWRVSSVNISQERVTFSRIKGREQAYITFFSGLLNELRKTSEFVETSVSLHGRSYITFHTLVSPDNRRLTYLGSSFARGKRFRAELYIDAGNEEQNDEIFSRLLEQKEEIEKEVGEQISWERLETRRGSRIAVYHEGSITDSENELFNLRNWAVEHLVKLYNIFHVKYQTLILRQDETAVRQ